jgi:hypothetical protein
MPSWSAGWRSPHGTPCPVRKASIVSGESRNIDAGTSQAGGTKRGLSRSASTIAPSVVSSYVPLTA